MTFSRTLLALLALAAAGCQPKPKPPEPVARIGSDAISAAELDKAVGADLKQMEAQYQQQIYQAKRQALEGIIQKRVFEAKAKAAGVATPEELIEKEVAGKIPDPSDEEVVMLYEQAKASGQQLPPIDQIKPDIIRFIKQQKAQRQLTTYYEALKAEMKVEVLLPAYLPPKVAVEAKGPAKGPKEAPITIVEFSDYQCPFCVKAEKTVAELLAAYPDKIRLVYRDFPLPNHPLAPKASEAAHCADDQGKYWEMHDKLFGVEGKLEVDCPQAVRARADARRRQVRQVPRLRGEGQGGERAPQGGRGGGGERHAGVLRQRAAPLRRPAPRGVQEGGGRGAGRHRQEVT